jgi:hypothetical protein
MRRKSVLVVLVILALGIIGTSLSTLYKQNEYIGYPPADTFKESYGFPLGWHGYSITGGSAIPVNPLPKAYWFSLESLLLDVAFWFTASFFVCLAVVKSATTARKAASKIMSVINVVVMYFFLSLSFLVAGLGLSLVAENHYFIGWGGGLAWVEHPYLDLGSRLFGFGIFLVVATFYQSLVREKKPSQKHFPTIS